MDFLEFDLNDIASNAIKEKFARLESTIKDLMTTVGKQVNLIEDLEKKDLDVKNMAFLVSQFKKTFENFEDVKKEGHIEICREKKQFDYISNILLFFDVHAKHQGWIGSWRERNLITQLLVNYYHEKELLIGLIKILIEPSSKEIKIIEKFKMPFEYGKEIILEFLKTPPYNTNGEIVNVSDSWVGCGAGLFNAPYSLLLQNPLVVEEDCFEQLLTSVRDKVPQSFYFFSVVQYNKEITDEQIQKLGECLLLYKDVELHYPLISGFITKNLKKFNRTTLEYFYEKIHDTNPYAVLYWKQFPIEYQKRCLKSMDLQRVLKYFDQHSIEWTTSDKEDFLKEYLNKQ